MAWSLKSNFRVADHPGAIRRTLQEWECYSDPSVATHFLFQAVFMVQAAEDWRRLDAGSLWAACAYGRWPKRCPGVVPEPAQKRLNDS